MKTLLTFLIILLSAVSFGAPKKQHLPAKGSNLTKRQMVGLVKALRQFVAAKEKWQKQHIRYASQAFEEPLFSIELFTYAAALEPWNCDKKSDRCLYAGNFACMQDQKTDGRLRRACRPLDKEMLDTDPTTGKVNFAICNRLLYRPKGDNPDPNFVTSRPPDTIPRCESNSMSAEELVAKYDSPQFKEDLREYSEALKDYCGTSTDPVSGESIFGIRAKAFNRKNCRDLQKRIEALFSYQGKGDLVEDPNLENPNPHNESFTSEEKQDLNNIIDSTKSAGCGTRPLKASRTPLYAAKLDDGQILYVDDSLNGDDARLTVVKDGKKKGPYSLETKGDRMVYTENDTIYYTFPISEESYKDVGPKVTNLAENSDITTTEKIDFTGMKLSDADQKLTTLLGAQKVSVTGIDCLENQPAEGTTAD